MVIQQQPSSLSDRPQVSSMVKSRRRSVSPAEPSYRLAQALVKQEKWQEAIAAYQQALIITPNWVEVQRELGDLFLKLERWDEAVQVYETAISLRSESAEVYHNLGDALLKLQRWEDAIAAYEKAIELNPEFSWSYNNLGDGLRELQRWDEAAQAYGKAIELKPDFALSHHNLGDILVKKEDWEGAIAAYQKAVDLDPNFVWSYYNLGDVLVRIKDWENAIAAYRSAVKLDPNLPQVHEKLGDALRHHSQIDSKEISQVYHRAVEQNPTDLQVYYKALEVNPQDAEMSLKLADTLRNQGKLEQAITFYRSTLQIDPNNPEIQAVAWQKLGDVLRHLRHFEEAAKSYHQLVELKPEWAESHFNLIRVLRQLGRLQETEKAGNRAVQIEPRLVNFYRNWGVIKGDILAVDTAYQIGERAKVAVCSWELAHNSAGRAYTLAQLYQAIADVEIIGSIFPQYGRELWEPIRKISIPCHSFTVEDEGLFLEQAMNLVLTHPYDIVHLSKPRMPNILFGLLYKMVWDARVIVDIDDEELTFVKASEPLDLAALLESEGKLPPFRDWDGGKWTRLAVGLARAFDGVTVANVALQKRYGGVVIRHARDEGRFVPSADLKRRSRERFGIAQDKRVVLFFGTPKEYKGLVATARALASLGRKDVVFAIIGNFRDGKLKEELQAIAGVDYLFVGNQPFESIPDVVAVGDICVLLQDVGSEVSQFQIPAKLSDALGMGLVVLLSETAAVADVIESAAVVRVGEGDLAGVLDRVLSDEAECDKLRVRGRELLAAEFGFGVNRPRLAGVMDGVRRGVGVLSDELNLLLAGFHSVGSVWSRLANQRKEDDHTKLEMIKPDDGSDVCLVYHRLGEALEELGRCDEAVEAYQKSGDLRTEVAGSQFNLSPILQKVSSDYKFKVESANQDTLRGWIVYNKKPDLVLDIDIFIDEVLFATIKNDQVRNDLKKLGLSSGLGGFKLTFPKRLFNFSTHQLTLIVRNDIEFSSIRISSNDQKISQCNYQQVSLLNTDITIIVPIYNAPDELEVCIYRLLKYTTISSKLLLIDDASTDSRIGEILSQMQHYRNIRLLKNEHNLGFTRTINRGIAESGRDDIVLLNSDARVTPRWLEGLRRAVASDPHMGTVTPMSDRAGAFSAPQIGNENDLPPEVTEIDYAVAFRRRSQGFYPTVPTGNGFCMYIRRSCIDDVGLFDENAFPRGYCEENDFCMRARKLGWKNIMDDRTYIFHDRNKSFGETKTDLIQAGRSIIDERYPDYKKAIRVFSESPQINLARFRAKQAQVDCVVSSGILPRALFVIATKTGGTPQTNLDLMEALSDRWETWLLHCDSRTLALSKIVDSQEEIIREHILTEEVEPLYHGSFEYDRVVQSWLMEYDFDLVHIRHLLWHSLSLPKLSHQSGAGVVMSFHDFYTVCPTVKLLDENNVFCGGKCTSTDGDCTPDLWPANSLPRLKNAWVKQWRKKFSEALTWCDMFVTTSRSVRETILRELPEIPSERFHIIPHGRNFSTFEQIHPTFKEAEPLRILIPGNISVAKGNDIIKMLLEKDKEGKLEFHILGNTSLKDKHPRLTFHGNYLRDDFVNKVQQIQPHVGAIFSIWNETWCHTLTELWSVGIPAIVFSFPTVAGRVIESGGGWVYDHNDIDQLYINIINEVSNVKILSEKRLAVVAWQQGEGKLNTTFKMSSRYQEVYRQAIDRQLSQARVLMAK